MDAIVKIVLAFIIGCITYVWLDTFGTSFYSCLGLGWAFQVIRELVKLVKVEE